MNPRKHLVEQVLTPPFIAVTNQPHELPRGMQRKRTRAPGQFESRFFWRAIAFAVVAAIAARDKVFPRRTPAARTRHHVVERKLRAWKYAPSELARVAVAQQNVFPRKRAALLRNMPVRKQSNHGGNSMGMSRGMHFRAVHLFRLRNAL